MHDAPWQQIDFPYVLRSSAITTAAGGFVGLFLGGIIRGRKPAQYAVWLSLNAAAGSTIFFGLQELVAIARRRDDFLNSAVAGFFSSYILSGIQTTPPVRARTLAVASSAVCSLSHFGLHRLVDRPNRAFEERLNSAEPESHVFPSDPVWLPVRRIDEEQLQDMQERSARRSIVLPPEPRS